MKGGREKEFQKHFRASYPIQCFHSSKPCGGFWGCKEHLKSYAQDIQDKVTIQEKTGESLDLNTHWTPLVEALVQ